MAKFKTDGFKMSKDFMSRGLFSDVRVFKDRGLISVIAVKDGLIIQGGINDYRYRAFNSFKDQLDVEAVIDKFIESFVK